jgi:hypothetical protein
MEAAAVSVRLPDAVRWLTDERLFWAAIGGVAESTDLKVVHADEIDDPTGRIAHATMEGVGETRG